MIITKVEKYEAKLARDRGRDRRKDAASTTKPAKVPTKKAGRA